MIFSVVVPFFNEETLIEECIGALLNQTFDKHAYELIFVDNGSTDRSPEFVRKHSTIKLLHESRRDPYIARNRGIEAARGRYIAFTDADCVADSRWLAELWHELDVSQADIVIGRLLYPERTSVFLRCYEHYYHTKLAYLFQQELRPCYHGHAGNMAVKASVFAKIGLFSGMPVVGDTEVIHRYMQRAPAANITYARKAKVVHAEVTRFAHCMLKLFQIGQYSQTYNTLSPYRPLRLQEKLQVFLANRTAQRYGPGMLLLSGVTLFFGWLGFEAGRWVRWLQAAGVRQS